MSEISKKLALFFIATLLGYWVLFQSPKISDLLFPDADQY
jgi:hypothetical protein